MHINSYWKNKHKHLYYHVLDNYQTNRYFSITGVKELLADCSERNFLSRCEVPYQ